MKKIFIFLIPIFSACSVFGINDTEKIDYEVLLTDQKMEIRLYEPFIKAEVEMNGKMSSNRDDSFKILAGYIFGKNSSQSNISMTSPVITKDKDSEKIAMTSPVVMSSDENRSQMFFKMPSIYTLKSLPKPEDKRIKISKEAQKIHAVITYSGSWDQSEFENKTKELKTWIKGIGNYKIISKAKYAGYNPPWTLPWLRKNEVLLEISK